MPNPRGTDEESNDFGVLPIDLPLQRVRHAFDLGRPKIVGELHVQCGDDLAGRQMNRYQTPDGSDAGMVTCKSEYRTADRLPRRLSNEQSLAFVREECGSDRQYNGDAQ